VGESMICPICGALLVKQGFQEKDYPGEYICPKCKEWFKWTSQADYLEDCLAEAQKVLLMEKRREFGKKKEKFNPSKKGSVLSESEDQM